MVGMKRILLQGAYNVRDLGGYPTREAKVTKWGLLFRGDSPSALTEEDWSILKKLNVKTMIDLRSNMEKTSAGITPNYEMNYYHCSLMQELENIPDISKLSKGDISSDKMTQMLGSEKFMESMKLDYVRTLFGNIDGAVTILNYILEELPQGGILFFCSAGKDRTGIIASLVLYLCDVIREDIIADYMVSSTYNTNGINKNFSSPPASMVSMFGDKEVLKDLFESKAETIISLLDAYKDRDIKELLGKNGFSKEKQEKLKEMFLQSWGD
ncbi:tyrosine-protein phosphatase [Anaerosporobacter sp.]|uniref:tyrosine-protein phosphatase n=1 Tax=Anaerosporobacter sp. TaxID=1872529 RepID=UPI00286ECB9B|nr:tyrosine-protein phosphatase [Anaerosporobacter sp.]